MTQSLSAPSLPDELNDQICSQVVSGSPRRVARETLLALALTSRSFVKATRRALYSNPFRFVFSDVTFATARPLLAALESKGVGVHVRELNSLAGWANSLTKRSVDNDPKFPYEIRGQPEGWAWSSAMVRACPSLAAVSLLVQTTTQVTKLTKPLRDIKSNLKHLTLNNAPIDLVVSLVNSARLSLDLLELLDLGAPSSIRVKPGSALERPSEAIMISSSLPLRSISDGLLPSSGLTKLELALTGPIGAEDIMHLLRSLGRPLITFKLLNPSVRYWNRSVELYGRGHSGYDIPLEAFSLLSSVKHLSLTGSRTISLTRLRALGPQLETLNLQDSVWVKDSDRDAILPEAGLNALLLSFGRLGSADLGFLPLLPWNGLPLVNTTASQQGFTLDYSTCYEYCDNCGEYH